MPNQEPFNLNGTLMYDAQTKLKMDFAIHKFCDGPVLVFCKN